MYVRLALVLFHLSTNVRWLPSVIGVSPDPVGAQPPATDQARDHERHRPGRPTHVLPPVWSGPPAGEHSTCTSAPELTPDLPQTNFMGDGIGTSALSSAL